MFVGHDFGWNVKLCVKKVKGRGICGQVLEIEMDGGLLGEKSKGENKGQGKKEGKRATLLSWIVWGIRMLFVEWDQIERRSNQGRTSVALSGKVGQWR